MRDAGTRQRRKRCLAFGRGIVKPGNEDVHFRLPLRGGWRFEMHFELIKPIGNDLHGIGMLAIVSIRRSPDITILCQA